METFDIKKSATFINSEKLMFNIWQELKLLREGISEFVNLVDEDNIEDDIENEDENNEEDEGESDMGLMRNNFMGMENGPEQMMMMKPVPKPKAKPKSKSKTKKTKQKKKG